MLQWLYTGGFYLTYPFLLFQLKAKQNALSGELPSRRQRWGYYTSAPLNDTIWLHVASVGEAIAAKPLIQKLVERHTNFSLVITTNTLTGYQQLQAMSVAATIVLAPLDLPAVLQRFQQQFKPRLYLMFERELWPNQLRLCEQHRIPVVIVNARLSARSLQRYRYVKFLFQPLFPAIHRVVAQFSEDAKRYQQLGIPAEKIHCAGNLKFDITVSSEILTAAQQWRQHYAANRLIWLAASTHAGEEELLLAAQQKILAVIPNALLIVVPRHPERFNSVAQLCQSWGLVTARRSLDQTVTDKTQVYLADTMGELLQWYALTDVAFVAGSLLPNIGGHNFIEPAVLAKPIVMGPYCENFSVIQQQFVAAGAVQLVGINDENNLAETIVDLLQNAALRKQIGQKAQALIAEHQGATQRLLTEIEEVLLGC